MRIPSSSDGSVPARPVSKTKGDPSLSSVQIEGVSTSKSGAKAEGVKYEPAAEIGKFAAYLRGIQEIRSDLVAAVRERLTDRQLYMRRLGAEQTADKILGS